MLSVWKPSFGVVVIFTLSRKTSTFVEVAPDQLKSAACNPLTLYPTTDKDIDGAGVGSGVGVGVGVGSGVGVGVGEDPSSNE